MDQPNAKSRQQANSDEWDVFISYASEDRLAVALPLANALQSEGIKVWFDQFELKLGDSLFTSIGEGLRSSRFGVVVLSPDFFTKGWTQRELGGLFSISTRDNRKSILPVWYKVSATDISSFSPLMSDIVAVRWEDGLASVVDQILSVVKPDHAKTSLPLPLLISVEVRKTLSKTDYVALINEMMGIYGSDEVTIALRSIALDIDQTTWIRTRALEILISSDTMFPEDWDEILQQPVTDVISSVINIVPKTNVVLTQDQIMILFNNPALPKRSTDNIGEVVQASIAKGADYDSSIFLLLASSSSWELKYNCVKAVIRLNDASSVSTLAQFATMSYWQPRQRIAKYLIRLCSEVSLSPNDRTLGIGILNQMISDGKTDESSKTMRQLREALSLLESSSCN